MYTSSISKMRKRCCCTLVLLSIFTHTVNSMTLNQAIELAIKHDPWLKGSKLNERSLKAQGKAQSGLPDPVINMGILNLPTDGFAFDQEPMTQARVGVSQLFSRGDTLAIRHKQFSQLAERQPLLRADRQAQTRLQISHIWLDAYQSQRTIKLIEQDRALFDQLVDIVEASYASAQSQTQQQDVVRSHLEVSRLLDRLVQLNSQFEVAKARLYRWLYSSEVDTISSPDTLSLALSGPVPVHAMPLVEMQTIFEQLSTGQLAELLSQHPAVKAIEQSIRANQTGAELAKQKYKAQWGVNASYAYRDNDQDNRSRADFFSLGLSLKLPLFTESNVDQHVKSAQFMAESSKTEKRLLVREMMGEVKTLQRKSLHLQQRLTLYTNTILKQMKQQSDASLTAYTNDEGDFAEVMRARIADLNARIETLEIKVALSKTAYLLAYYLDDHPALAAFNQ